MMKAKPVLIIVGSVLIGIIIGFLVSAQLRHRRMKPVRVFTSERYFREVLYRVIEPDPELQKKLEPVIKKYGRQSIELQEEFRKRFDTQSDDYWKEIKQLLTDEQLKQIEDYRNRMREERERFRREPQGRGYRNGNRPGEFNGPQYHRGPRDSTRPSLDSLREQQTD